VKVERRADHAIGEAPCRDATGRTLAGWFEVLDAHGGIALGHRELGKWIGRANGVDAWWAATITNEYEIARGDLATDGRPRGYSICPTRRIGASPRACFDGFATARALDRWFGPRNQLDLRDGGLWSCADGNRATLRTVNPGKNLRLVAEDAALTLPTPVEIRFTPHGANCTVRVAIERLQTRAEADGYRHAWSAALDRLKSAVEGAA
jgi:uncharacterized protein YndB with AHSA1/START domain